MGCISSRHGATSSSTVVAGAKTFNFFLTQHIFSFGVCRRCGKLIIPRAKRVVSAPAYKSGVRNSASHISGCENISFTVRLSRILTAFIISFQLASAKSSSVIKTYSTLLSCPLRSGLPAGGLAADAGVVLVMDCLLRVRQEMGCPRSGQPMCANRQVQCGSRRLGRGMLRRSRGALQGCCPSGRRKRCLPCVCP
jgi:hypothetical protein